MDQVELDKRKPVWLAISEFYLDTELDKIDIARIIEVFQLSGYTISELKDIDYYEVKPIVGSNLFSTAGEWAGFDPEWLWNEIESKSLNKKRQNNFITRWRRKSFDTSRFNYWNKFSSDFEQLSTESLHHSISLNSTKKLKQCIIQSNADWNDFYELSAQIEKQLAIIYSEKIEDLDSKYWDFNFRGSTFTLHNHSMVGDIEIHTPIDTNTSDFQELLSCISKK